MNDRMQIHTRMHVSTDTDVFAETLTHTNELHLARVADLANDGGDVDDAASLLLQHDLGSLLRDTRLRAQEGGREDWGAGRSHPKWKCRCIVECIISEPSCVYILGKRREGLNSDAPRERGRREWERGREGIRMEIRGERQRARDQANDQKVRMCDMLPEGPNKDDITWEQRKTPARLTSMTAFQSSNFMRRTRVSRVMPALLIRQEMGSSKEDSMVLNISCT